MKAGAQAVEQGALLVDQIGLAQDQQLPGEISGQAREVIGVGAVARDDELEGPLLDLLDELDEFERGDDSRESIFEERLVIAGEIAHELQVAHEQQEEQRDEDERARGDLGGDLQSAPSPLVDRPYCLSLLRMVLTSMPSLRAAAALF